MICIYCSSNRKNKRSLESHQRLCKLNPTRKNISLIGRLAWNKNLTKFSNEKVKTIGQTLSNNIRNGITIPAFKNKTHSEESKLKISDSMKLAHIEERAWNIGKSRWNNEQSYPEKFFELVIQNEFSDKNYTIEHNVGRYSIDFAWLDKKLAIEIDGCQHQRFQQQIQNDIKKDLFLRLNGWKILRINWQELFHNTKYQILIAKKFIDIN